MSGKYLITGGLIVTLDDSLGNFENGAILIEDGIIKAVGRSDDIPADGAEVIDATEGVVIPGMVDTHRHATLSLMRGISVDENSWSMLANTYHPLVPLIGVEEVRTSALEYSQDELICVGVHLTQPGGVPMTWLRDEINFARDQGAFCCSHSNCILGSDLSRDLDVREDMRCMLPGHLYIHCPSLTVHDMGLIAKTGGKVSFATDSNIQTGMGYPPLRMALDHGLKPSLGTDSAMTTPTDMLSTMRLQLQAQRGLDHHALHLTGQPSTKMYLVTRDALVWGTRNGASSLGLGDKLGTLVPGKRADIVVITNKRRLSPSVHPLGTAILQSPADVDLIMVDGRILKHDGHLVGVDMGTIRDRARKDSRRILQDLERRRLEVGVQKAGDVIPLMEEAQRASFAEIHA